MCIKFAFLGFFLALFWLFWFFLSSFEGSLLILFCRTVLKLSSISLHFFHQGMLIDSAFLGFFSLSFRFFGSFFFVFESSVLIFLCRTILQLSPISLHLFHPGMLNNLAFLGFFSLYFRFFSSFFVVFESSVLIFL